MTTTRRRLAGIAPALVLGLGLAACSGAEPAADPSDDQPADVGTAEPAAGGQADADFAQMMIVHHQGALEMAQLAVEKASSEDVRALGEKIAAAQGPEIETMSGWLEAWGEESPDEMGGGMDHGDMDMGSTGQEEVMAELEGLSGVDFDRRFLELMIEHHRGAIEMAEAQLAEGENEEALQLARKIIDDQTAEIDEMGNMLRAL